MSPSLSARATALVVALIFLASSTMWVAAQDTPTAVPEPDIPQEAPLVDPNEPDIPVSIAGVDAIDASRWTVNSATGVATLTRSNAGPSGVEILSPVNGPTSSSYFVVSSGTRALAFQVFSPGFSDVALAGWARLRSGANTNGLKVMTRGNHSLILGTNDTPRITITGDGRVDFDGGVLLRGGMMVQKNDGYVEMEPRPAANGLPNAVQFRTDKLLYYFDEGADFGGGVIVRGGMRVQKNDGYVEMEPRPAVDNLPDAVRFKTDKSLYYFDKTVHFAQAIKIAGGGDLAESFDVNSHDQVEPGMVVAIDPETPGELRVADRAYDRTVAGVVSGAGGVNPGLILQQEGSIVMGEHPVALTGRVYVMANTSNGEIQPGDLLTTSDVPGHAMKVTDYELAQGAIIGKAMTQLDEETGLVLVLVSLQ